MKHNEQISYAVNLRLSAFICGFVLKLITNKYSSMSQMFTDPCKSARSAKSAFYRTDPRTKSTEGKVSGYIRVHPRVFYDVAFQTGSTGWTGYDFNSVSNFEELGV